ncbi:amino acid adenylation domain-containing protein [Nostoc sp. LEGE 06077]|uniref:non-ribosomal peptide synthetase n=1 Tax=Nostoc sp. LEGE 06077 TaxID=915325 RepID=UPI0018829129|nr:non-ribosomal peptide synthetase [Nostoc sp. LEGE 06077]MBE9209296.1 amino acid adenylation domain-containing protein [Nostoc sp. LEGE 06077]
MPTSKVDVVLLKIKEILGTVFGVKTAQIDIHTSLLELGFESLVLIQFSRSLQEKLGVKIPFRQLLEEFSTLHDLAVHIAQQLPPSFYQEKIPAITEPSVSKISDRLLSKSLTTALNNHSENQAISDDKPRHVYARLVAEQLKLMTKQLDLLRHNPLPHKNYLLHQVFADIPQPQKSVNIQQSDKVTLNPRQQQHLDALITKFVQRTSESKRLTQEARSFHANPRSITGFRLSLKEMLYPIHAQRGAGARIWDVDGNEYIDMSMGFGALLFGHFPNFVAEAMQQHIQQGIQNGPQSPLTNEVAKLFCELTNQERVTFCNSGTDAVMGAIRIARATTGRSKIAVFNGSYHGTLDEVLVAGISTADGTLHSLPAAPGIPQHFIENVIVLNYGSPESLETLKAHSHELAAVLVEPIQSRRPDFQPKEFLQELRQLTTETGIVLIFDEVITGFRMHPGGIQAMWNIQADISTYGKALGSGLPIGVIAGKAAFMDALDGGFWNYGDASSPQRETTIFAGTFFKNPLVMSVALAVLNHIKNSGEKVQAELAIKTAKIADTLNSYFQQKQLPIQVVYFGSLFRFVYPSNLVWINLLFYHLIEKGIYIWEGRSFYLSTAHTDEDIETLIRAIKDSILELQAGDFLPQDPPGMNNQGDELSHSQEIVTLPLTEVQKELWFMAQIGDHASRAYNQSMTIHLRGEFQLEVAYKAVQTVINRHEALRTSFSSEGDYQLIHPKLTIDIPYIDLSTLDGQHRLAQLAEFLKQEAQETFDLEKTPLLRFHIIKLEPSHHLLVLTIHHIVADGWSMAIILRELAAIYAAESQSRTCELPQPMQYSEYVQWQTLQQTTPEMAKAEAYWLKQFSGSVPVLNLPDDKTRPLVNTYNGAIETLSINTALYHQLKSLSEECKCTLFSTLLAGYMVLLQRLSNQNDIVVGIASAGQSLVNHNCLVGHCVNLLLIRIQVDKSPVFTDYLSYVKEQLLAAYDHQVYPFIKLVKNLNLLRDQSRNPLFTVGFNLDKSQFELDNLDYELEVIKNSNTSAKFDIDLNIIQSNTGLLLELEYNTDLFKSETIQRWVKHYMTLLESIVANPQQRISKLLLLTKIEKQQLLVEWNNTQAGYPQDKCIHQLFEIQAEKTPDAIAVLFDNQYLTYQELNHKANQLARYLRKKCVKPDILLGICVERSLEMIVGILGTLKAGGAYLPLDPAYPQERLSFMLADANLSLVLTQQRLQEWLPQHQHQTIYLDADWQLISQETQESLEIKVTDANLAYVIYTSGSTGKPKGVMVQHHSLVNYTRTAIVKYGMKTSDIILQFASICFDVAAEEIFTSLVVGAKLVLRNDSMLSSVPAFLEQCRQFKITVLALPTAFWHQITAELDDKLVLPKAIRLVIIGGEKALPQRLAIWRQRVNKKVQLINSYGPTEATIGTTISNLSNLDEFNVALKEVPIGKVIDNVQVYILDAYFQPTPIGIPGEIYIGGMGVARGYLNQPQLTAEKFIPNLFSNEPGTRLYQTGDLARYLPDGEIEILGRVDEQVKIRGFRIELGEVEAQLNQHPNVGEAVVKVWEDEQGDKQLVGYVSSLLKPQLTATQLRSFLKEHLPEYMIPSNFVILESLPITPNGKINRLALPNPEKFRPEFAPNYVIPQTEVEQTIAKIWEKALNLESIGIHDNFFEIGGHSLLLIKVHSELRKIFPIDLSMLDLFRYPTISYLADYLSKLKNQPVLDQQEDNQVEKITSAKEQQKKRLQKMKSARSI